MKMQFVVMEKAIQYSNKHKIFKQVDNLYRLAAAQAMMAEDEIEKGVLFK